MKPIIISLILSLFIGASATGCTDSDGAEPNSSIRVETAEVTAITSDNALSGGRVIGETENSHGVRYLLGNDRQSYYVR